MVIVTSAKQTQPWNPLLLEMLVQCPLLLTPLPDPLLYPQGSKHPSSKQETYVSGLEGFRKCLEMEEV